MRSFTFIHQDPGPKAKTKLDRGAINAHSQNAYHKARRQKNVLSAQKEASLKWKKAGAETSSPNSPESTDIEAADDQPQRKRRRIRPREGPAEELYRRVLRRRNSSRLPNRYSTDPNDEVKPPAEIDEDDIVEESLHEQEAPSEIVSPLVMLNKGGTDPFDVFPIRLDATSAHLLQFGSQAIFPLAFPVERRFGLAESVTTKCVDRASTALQDPCHATAFFSTLALAIGVSPYNRVDLKKLGWYYQNQSYRFLQGCIGSDISTQTYGAIYQLFSGQMVQRNYQEAKVHWAVLCRLLPFQPRTDPFLLENLATCDLQFAITEFRRPSFEWIESLESFYVDGAKAQLPAIFDAEEDPSSGLRPLPLTLAETRLRSIFLDIGLLLVLDATSDVVRITPSVVRWMSTRLLSCRSRLLNYIIDLEEQNGIGQTRQIFNPEKKVQVDDTLVYHYTAIAGLIYCSVVFLHHISADFEHRILPRLRSAVMLADQHAPNHINSHSTLYLWTMYVGAAAEADEFRPAGSWFCNRFSAEAGKFKMNSTTTIEEELEQVLFSRLWQPHYTTFRFEHGLFHNSRVVEEAE